jgi:hypothetical protein
LALVASSAMGPMLRALVYIGVMLVGAGTPVIFDATAHRRAWRDLARAAPPALAEVP